jgi:hypothetical protein
MMEPSTGGCLCGAVRYAVRGPLRSVLVCHCEECRRWHGAPAQSTAAPRDRFDLTEQRGLRWVDSPRSDAHARRGFCGECGSSLFWDAPGRDYVAIAAGSVDGPTGVRTTAHWYVSQKGDWYDLPDDGLPRHEGSAAVSGADPSP